MGSFQEASKKASNNISNKTVTGLVKIKLTDSSPRVRKEANSKGGIVYSTTEIKNFAKNPNSVKKGSYIYIWRTKKEGNWHYGQIINEYDDLGVTVNWYQNQIKAGKTKATIYNELIGLVPKTGYIYGLDGSQAKTTKKSSSGNKEIRDGISKEGIDPSIFRSAESGNEIEKKLERSTHPITTFLPPDSIGYGYSLLFNFISGNPFFQGKYVERAAPSGKGSLFTKSFSELTGGKISSSQTVLSKIGPQRLQTKILSYKEDSLSQKGYVHLPLNTVMRSTSDLQYGAKALALFEDALTSYIRGGAEGALNNVLAELGFQVGGDTGMGQVQMAANKFLGTDIDVVAAFRSQEFVSGTSTNPRTYEQYTGTAPRAFEFKYTFHPESIKQAKDILAAINKLKYHSFARRGVSSPVRMMNPDRVIVRLFWGALSNVEDPPSGNSLETSYLFVVKPCVITKVDVGYGSAEEIGTYFDEGVPAEISLTLGLKEQENTYADDIVEERVVKQKYGPPKEETTGGE